MAERETIREVLAGLATVAPDLSRAIEANGRAVVDVWHDSFGHRPDAVVNAGARLALNRHRERNLTPAHLHDYCDEAEGLAGNLPTLGEVWRDVVEGINAWDYHRGWATDPEDGWSPQFGQVTEDCARALGGWASISEDGVNMDVLRSNFLRIHQEVAKRQRDTRRLPPRETLGIPEIARGLLKSVEDVES